MGGQISLILSIFKAASNSLEELPWSILVRRPHKELCLREPMKLEVRGDERHWSVRSGIPAARGQRHWQRRVYTESEGGTGLVKPMASQKRDIER